MQAPPPCHRHKLRCIFKDEWAQTTDGEWFLMAEDGDDKTIIKLKLYLLMKLSTHAHSSSTRSLPFMHSRMVSNSHLHIACYPTRPVIRTYQRTLELPKGEGRRAAPGLIPQCGAFIFRTCHHPSCRAVFPHYWYQGVLSPLLPVSQQKDSELRSSGCLPRRSQSKQLHKEDSSPAVCTTEVCETGMAGGEG